MSRRRYSLLGLAAWHGGRWYLRRRRRRAWRYGLVLAAGMALGGRIGRRLR